MENDGKKVIPSKLEKISTINSKSQKTKKSRKIFLATPLFTDSIGREDLKPPTARTPSVPEGYFCNPLAAMKSVITLNLRRDTL